MLVPVVAEHLGGVHGAIGTVATGQISGGAVTVAAPADSLRVLRVQRKRLGHDEFLINAR